MMSKIIALTLFIALFIAISDTAANNAQIAGEATNIITESMRAILGVIVEFIGQVLDEFVRAFKNFF